MSKRSRWYATWSAGLVLLTGAALAGPQWGGCDLIQQSRAQTPDPAPLVPTPVVESPAAPETPAEPQDPIVIDGDLLPGKFLTVRATVTATDGGKVAYFWTASPGLDYLDGDAPTGTESVFTGDDGNFWFELEVARTSKDGEPLKSISWRKEFTLGQPGPPAPEKTIKELAGEDAQKLADFYNAFAKAVDSYASPDDFWGLHTSGLKAWGLAENKALPKIAAKLAPIGKGTGPFPAEAGKAALLAVVAELGNPTPPPVDPTVKVTAVTYVYEKDQTATPSVVMVALDKLNRQGVLATQFEDDSTDGDDDVPEQYRVPLDAARKAGLPALVSLAGNDVLKVIRDPRTEQQVFEAIAP